MEANSGISIVIPTLYEVKNIPALVARIFKVDFGLTPFEVILVDDNSADGTVEVVEELRKQFNGLKIIVRQTKRDLSQSVIDGFYSASYPNLVTMDADLSHPPEKIPEMVAALYGSSADIVLGSRYVSGGSMDGTWPLHRKMVSRASAFIARMLLAAKVKDPLSGFVAIRKATVFSGDQLETIGWKFGLELMVKCHCKNIREIPIHFSQRYLGSSKLNFKVALNYFQHVLRLMKYKKYFYRNSSL